ncbi:MAG: hypothetical protein IKL62_01115 [Clostridia bacterium]|nr:hypothetical protein [Clostridia bacterium]
MKFTRIMFFLVLASAAAVYARTTQLLFLTEEKTGFFMHDGKTGAVALSVFIVLVIVSCAVMTLFTRRNPSGPPDDSIYPRIGAAALAVAALYEAFFVKYISDASIIILLTRISAVFAAFSLLLYILRYFIPALSKISKMVYLPVLVFFMLKLVLTFTVYSTVSVIADNIFHIAFLCVSLMFMLCWLKLENGIRPGRSAYRLFPLGTITFIVAACCVIPAIVVSVMGRPSLLHSDPNSLVFPAATAIFALLYVLSLYSKKNIVRRKRNTPRLESNTSYHEMSGQFVSGSGKRRRKR